MANPEIREKCKKGGYSHRGKIRGPLSEEVRKKISERTKIGMQKMKERKQTERGDNGLGSTGK